MVYDVYGWAAALVTLAVLTILPTILILRYRETARTRDRVTLGQAYSALATVLRRPGARRWMLVVMPLSQAASSAAYAMITPALVDGGGSLTRIGLALNIAGSVVAIGAALLTGAFIARRGARPALLGSLVLTLAVTTGLAPLMFGSLDDLLTAGAVALYLAGYTSVMTVVYAVNMSWCREATAGSDFTFLNSLSMVASLLVASVVVVAAGSFGYPTMLGVCGLVAVVALLVVFLLPPVQHLTEESVAAAPLPR